MKTPHKHAEVLQAIAEGRDVQCRRRGSPQDWAPLFSYDAQVELIEGGDRYEYRIKPEPRKGWYRVALHRPAPGRYPIELVFTDGGEELTQHAEGFIRWLTPRTEYEVDVE